MSSECWYDDSHLAEPRCGKRAVFRVLRRDADPVHPDPARDSRECCRAHLPVTVELADEAGEPGRVVPVTVIGSTP